MTERAEQESCPRCGGDKGNRKLVDITTGEIDWPGPCLWDYCTHSWHDSQPVPQLVATLPQGYCCWDAIDGTGKCQHELINSVRDIYYSACWSSDRLDSATEQRMWTRLRDAAGFEKGNSPKPVPAVSEEIAEPITVESLLLEIAAIYGLDENFMRALPAVNVETWRMLVLDNVRRQENQRNVMEMFRAKLNALLFPASPSTKRDEPK